MVPDPRIASTIGRANLLLITRLVLKGLLEYCMQSKCRMLHSENQQLTDFFIVVEKVLRHGFKASRNMISLRTPDQELWTMVDRLGKTSGDILAESVQCIEQLPSVNTSLGRIRSWLRLAVMQKKLADYFNTLIESKLLLKEYYEEWALLRHETDAIIFTGSLIGIRVLDCNLYLKDDDLSSQALDVDLNLYVKLPSVPTEIDESDENATKSEENILDQSKKILEQKDYLEERNRALLLQIENMTRRLSVVEDMQKHKNDQDEENKNSTKETQLQSIDTSRLERVEEIETAMALLEKSVHEKQDTIVSLRQQIDDIKKINLDLYQKLRKSEENFKDKEKLSIKLKTELDATQSHFQEKVSQLEISQADISRRMKKSEELVASLQFENNQKSEFCAKLQNEIVEMNDLNKLLEDSLKSERLVREDLDVQLQRSQSSEQTLHELKKQHDHSQRKNQEYERTLEELGVSLSESKLKVDELKEEMAPLSDAQWENDKETTACKLCLQKFSVSRRKHHCRNCGGIFCNPCSEKTMPLPSSAKPVRVCDTCHAILLERISSKNVIAVPT